MTSVPGLGMRQSPPLEDSFAVTSSPSGAVSTSTSTAVILLPVTGYWLVFELHGNMANLPVPYHIMHGLGWIMIFIFLHLWFAPYARFKRAVAGGDIPEAAKHLNTIRLLAGQAGIEEVSLRGREIPDETFDAIPATTATALTRLKFSMFRRSSIAAKLSGDFTAIWLRFPSAILTSPQ